MVSNLDIFTRACKKTLGALEGAIKETKAVSNLKDFDMSKFDNLDTVKAFSEAQELIKESFTSLSVSPVSLNDVRARRQTFPTQINTDWTKDENNLEKAVEKDRAIVKDLHKIMNEVSIRSPSSQTSNADNKLQGPGSASKKVKVTVAIEKEGNPAKSTSGTLFTYFSKVEADMNIASS